MRRKGILLAGGTGSRLFPVTLGVSKQLLPVYDKPMIFHPLCTLMSAGIREIAVVTTPGDAPAFQRLLGDGSAWGISITWLEQPVPDGLPSAYGLAEAFLDGAPSAMILGDNLFHGPGLTERLTAVDQRPGATVWGYRVADPGRYGVIELEDGRPVGLVEKPAVPPSPWVLTGLYHLDGTAPQRARSLRPSARGETEITDLLRTWLPDALHLERLGSGFAWLDTGTHDSLLEASQFVRTLQVRQGVHVASPEETALAQGWIDAEGVLRAARRYGDCAYATYLRGLASRRTHVRQTVGGLDG